MSEERMIGIVGRGQPFDEVAVVLQPKVDAPPTPLPPTHGEMKAALKDPTLPDVVKRHIREQLYGQGGGGRKANQQVRLLQEMQKMGRIGQRKQQPIHTPDLKKPAGMSGRQFKRARKLIQRGRKAMFG